MAGFAYLILADGAGFPAQSRAHHGEETVEKLAIYTANRFDHVRVEACDTCHYYIKTVDLTKNGLAVPVVDELATIPLNHSTSGLKSIDT